MLDKYMTKRPGSSKWQLRVPVPKDVQGAYGRPVVTRSLGEEDELKATAKAVVIVQALKEAWANLRAGTDVTSQTTSLDTEFTAELSEQIRLDIARHTYRHVLQQTDARRAEASARDPQAYQTGLGERITKRRELSRDVRSGRLEQFEQPTETMAANRGVLVDRNASWFRDLTHDVATATIDARSVSDRIDQGEIDPQPTSDIVRRALSYQTPLTATRDVAFSDLADQFMRLWLASRSGSKETNTEQQKRATFRLFAGFYDDRPIRAVTGADAASFYDTLRLFHPSWARSPSARKLNWATLVEKFGGQKHGLSDATMNRHLQVLKELWQWAQKRGHCAGENPFDGFRERLRLGVNVQPYVAWSDDELKGILSPPPKRQDLLEVIIVGLFTGMRLDEIASLTWGQVRAEQVGERSIPFFEVVDAKTPAGNRQVPVHPDLTWLLRRDRGADNDRLWPTFNEEGRGKKAGADASREFSRFKADRGFNSPTKTFHSFRKNVTRIMERARVHENDWAQIFGHERGFTYGRYNEDGLDMARKAEIIAIIDYPNVAIPHPRS